MVENGMDLTGIDFLGIDRVLKRGTGKVIERQDAAILVHDSNSGAWMLGCEDAELGADILRRRLSGDCRLLMVSDHSLGLKTFAQYGFRPADLLDVEMKRRDGLFRFMVSGTISF